jgi:pimeloyl-ACP methyl ester carboxylesterase
MPNITPQSDGNDDGGVRPGEAQRFGVPAVAQTAIGNIPCRLFGTKGPTIIALPGLAGVKLEAPSWDLVARQLASKYQVVLPDPHANPRSRPNPSEFATVKTIGSLGGLLTSKKLKEDWLLDFLPDSGPVVLAGHSWGGGAACRFAAAHPERVTALVVSSPNVQRSTALKLKACAMPTLLLHNRDDAINPFGILAFSWAGTQPNLTTRRFPKGGHRVIPDHAEAIGAWLDTVVIADGAAGEAPAAAAAAASARSCSVS